jgi:acetoacetyl-CoA synthetase
VTDPATDGSEPIWLPDPARAEATQLRAFMREASGVAGVEFEDFDALHRWSIAEPGAFWSLVWDACRIIGDRGSPEDRPIVTGKRMMDARFFPEARLNFAENLLWRSDDAPALVFRNERGTRRELSFATLRREVARLQRALRDEGIGVGDRVAGYLPNLPETIIAMLATASLGATWSSCSPDFGSAGVIDRFEQIEPSVLFATDGYTYGGKHFDCLPRLPEILAAVPSIRHCVVVPYTDEAPALDSNPKLSAWSDFVGAAAAEDPSFTRVPFDQPLYIVFSSGTTGKPKCIVHGVGGSLLQHAKEHRLHVDLSGEDHLFYFTTCGWMMWNWLVSGLATGARLILYDGSPAHPDGHTLFELAERERVTVFGTSAKFIDALAKEGMRPAEHADLSSLRTLLSTGSPLAPEGFDYIQQHIGRDIQIASISGGTDILSCFVLGNPISPVYRGEIQGPGLGMQVEVFDDAGKRVVEETGELVCTAPFPSMPVGFWRDDDEVRYHTAYFERFESAGRDVWCHGDFTQETAHGGYVIFGRSDAVLNPGGVRIGTAEIYRQVEAIPEVVEGLAIGQAWQDDVRVVLFVRLRDGAVLDDALTQRIRQRIQSNTTPRHVPARVVQVADIPRTRSGKITELAVREVVHGRPVKNIEALANPEALEHFRNRVELAE